MALDPDASSNRAMECQSGGALRPGDLDGDVAAGHSGFTRRPPTISYRWWIQFFGHFPFVGIPIVASIARAASTMPAGKLERPGQRLIDPFDLLWMRQPFEKRK